MHPERMLTRYEHAGTYLKSYRVTKRYMAYLRSTTYSCLAKTDFMTIIVVMAYYI